MSDSSAVQGRLDEVAAELMRHGLEVDIPAGEPPDQDAGTGYLRVRHPVTGQYAEVRLVRHGPDPADALLELNYWTTPGQDPDGQQMASRVRQLLDG